MPNCMQTLLYSSRRFPATLFFTTTALTVLTVGLFSSYSYCVCGCVDVFCSFYPQSHYRPVITGAKFQNSVIVGATLTYPYSFTSLFPSFRVLSRLPFLFLSFIGHTFLVLYSAPSAPP